MATKTKAVKAAVGGDIVSLGGSKFKLLEDPVGGYASAAVVNDSVDANLVMYINVDKATL